MLDGRVSNVSPIGRAIMGHKVGDRVQVVPEKGEPYYLVIRKIENTQMMDHLRLTRWII